MFEMREGVAMDEDRTISLGIREQRMLAQALADGRLRYGVHWPQPLADLEGHLLAALSRQNPPYPAIRLIVDPDHPDTVPVLLSYADAADALGVSTRTVSRMVAAGLVESVGRRVTRASVQALGAKN